MFVKKGVLIMSVLEDIFSLGRNGGIYLDRNRVHIQEDILALFIGLGGMGISALLQLKNQIMSRVELPYDENRKTKTLPKNIAFLAFDTSSISLHSHYFSTTLNNTEIVNISPGTTTTWNCMIKKIEMDKKNGLEYAQFLPDNVGNCGTDAEAGARRLMGKVAFIHHAHAIREKIQMTLYAMQGNVPEYKIRVFVFTGLSDGTGSGMFLDMGYLLKTMTAGQAQIIGYFFLNDLHDYDPGSASLREVNTYAALRELDDAFKHDAEVQTYSYGPEFSDRMNAPIPYDYYHILSQTTAEGPSKTKGEVVKSAVESVFTDFIFNSSITYMGEPNIYDNLDHYICGSNFDELHPASRYCISLDSISIRVPYMEISTLIAGRMFESLEHTVFANHVTEQSFDEDMELLGLGSRKYFEDFLSSLFENYDTHIKNVNFDNFKDYVSVRYGDAWENTYDNVERYRSAIVNNFKILLGSETDPVKLKVKLKQFIHNAVVDPKRGPFYIKEVINGTDLEGSSLSLNLLALLSSQQINFRQRSAKCRIAAESAKMQCKNIYGEDELKWFNFIKKRKYVDRYNVFLQEWYKNKCEEYRYEYMSRACNKMKKIYREYYDNIIVPITNLLFEMTNIFKRNVAYLVVYDDKCKTKPAPSIFITPIEFEKIYSTDFSNCVKNAEGNFLRMLSETMKDWIRCDIDNIIPDVSYHTDIQGRMSEFISDCFERFFRNINIESILNDKIPVGQDIMEYSNNLISDMFSRIIPSFERNKHSDYVLSVPSNCPNILLAANNFSYENLLHVRVIDEQDRISLCRLTADFPFLYQKYENNYAEYKGYINSPFLYTKKL